MKKVVCASNTVAAARVWQRIQHWTRKRLVVLASVGRPDAIVVRAVIRSVRTVSKAGIILGPGRGCANYQHRCHKRRSAKIFEFASHYAPPCTGSLLHGAFAATLTGSATPRIPYKLAPRRAGCLYSPRIREGVFSVTQRRSVTRSARAVRLAL